MPNVYQSPRGWGPPPGAISGRGGVYQGGQRLTPGPTPGMFFGPQLQGASQKFGGGGQMPNLQPGWTNSAAPLLNSQGMPTQGGWGSLYGNAPRPESPFGNNRGGAPTPYQAPAAPAVRPGGITSAVQAMQRGDMAGARAYANQGAGLPQTAPHLNTTAQVQTGGPPVLRKGFGF